MESRGNGSPVDVKKFFVDVNVLQDAFWANAREGQDTSTGCANLRAVIGKRCKRTSNWTPFRHEL